MNKSLILGNLRNYAIMFITITFYIFFAYILQTVGGLSSITATLIADIVICVICAFFYFYLRRETFEGHECFEAKDTPDIKTLVLYFLYFVFVSLTMTIVFTWFTETFTDPNMEQRSVTFSKMDFVTYLLLSCVIAPIQEEFMNRLFLYNLIKTKSHWLVSAVVTSFVFGALHGTIGHVIFGSLFGLILALAYERTKMWIVPILGHMVYNMSLFAMPADDITALASIDIVVIFTAIIFILNIVGQIVYLFRRKARMMATADARSSS